MTSDGGKSLLNLLTDANGTPKASRDIQSSRESYSALEFLFSELASNLQDNHRTVLGAVMGFGTPKRSQTELARQLGLTRARISAITAQAIKNLIGSARAVNIETPAHVGSDIAVYKGDQIQAALSWANLSDEDLRREAMRSANLRDAEALWALTEAFLTLYSSKRSKVSGHTLRTYRRGVFDLIDVWADENLLQPSRDAGPKYLLKLETTPYRVSKVGTPLYYKPETLNAKLSAARTLYKALRWAKATTADPFSNVKPVHDPIPPEEKRLAYTQAEVSSLVAHASTVDKAFILLCAHGGLRAAEVTGLQWGQVDLKRGGMTVLGKGNKEQWVGFSDDLLTALQELYEGQVPNSSVLPFRDGRARERLADLCQMADVEYKGIHSLRHYAGTRMWELHRSLDAPADHLRHANVQTTRRYAKKSRAQRRELARGLKVSDTSEAPDTSTDETRRRLLDNLEDTA